MENTADKYRAILGRYLPGAAVEWVYGYLNLHRIHLHIARERRTKLGDYRRPYPGHERHEISVNGDLSKPLFLWVFLHEAAHLETRLSHPHAQPHGHEWQAHYARLLADHIDWFPTDTQPLIARYIRRIPLNRALCRQIETALRGQASTPTALPTLDQQQPGIRFRLKTARPPLRSPARHAPHAGSAGAPDEAPVPRQRRGGNHPRMLKNLAINFFFVSLEVVKRVTNR